jgi:hypothetical protein
MLDFLCSKCGHILFDDAVCDSCDSRTENAADAANGLQDR